MSHDSIRVRLQFPNPEWIIGMPVANHIKFFSKPSTEGEAIICRPYSPITPINTKGYIDFVIKCYPITEEFPAGGKMGHYLRTLNVGDTMTCEGPIGMC